MSHLPRGGYDLPQLASIARAGGIRTTKIVRCGAKGCSVIAFPVDQNELVRWGWHHDETRGWICTGCDYESARASVSPGRTDTNREKGE